MRLPARGLTMLPGGHGTPLTPEAYHSPAAVWWGTLQPADICDQDDRQIGR